MAEHKWNSSYFYDSFLPDAFQIYLSEIAVDWIKHAFVTKFNNIEADSVYVLSLFFGVLHFSLSIYDRAEASV